MNIRIIPPILTPIFEKSIEIKKIFSKQDI